MTNEELERAVERAMKKRDHPSSDTLGFTTLATADFDTIMKALSERAELLAAVERMRGALEGFVEGIECAPISWETGCCCCGSPVDSHGFGDGHSPVDEGVYFITQLIKAARAALITGEGK